MRNDRLSTIVASTIAGLSLLNTSAQVATTTTIGMRMDDQMAYIDLTGLVDTTVYSIGSTAELNSNGFKAVVVEDSFLFNFEGYEAMTLGIEKTNLFEFYGPKSFFSLASVDFPWPEIQHPSPNEIFSGQMIVKIKSQVPLSGTDTRLYIDNEPIPIPEDCISKTDPTVAAVPIQTWMNYGAGQHLLEVWQQRNFAPKFSGAEKAWFADSININFNNAFEIWNTAQTYDDRLWQTEIFCSGPLDRSLYLRISSGTNFIADATSTNGFIDFHWMFNKSLESALGEATDGSLIDKSITYTLEGFLDMPRDMAELSAMRATNVYRHEFGFSHLLADGKIVPIALKPTGNIENSPQSASSHWQSQLGLTRALVAEIPTYPTVGIYGENQGLGDTPLFISTPTQLADFTGKLAIKSQSYEPGYISDLAIVGSCVDGSQVSGGPGFILSTNYAVTWQTLAEARGSASYVHHVNLDQNQFPEFPGHANPRYWISSTNSLHTLFVMGENSANPSGNLAGAAGVNYIDDSYASPTAFIGSIWGIGTEQRQGQWPKNSALATEQMNYMLQFYHTGEVHPDMMTALLSTYYLGGTNPFLLRGQGCGHTRSPARLEGQVRLSHGQ